MTWLRACCQVLHQLNIIWPPHCFLLINTLLTSDLFNEKCVKEAGNGCSDTVLVCSVLSWLADYSIHRRLNWETGREEVKSKLDAVGPQCYWRISHQLYCVLPVRLSEGLIHKALPATSAVFWKFCKCTDINLTDFSAELVACLVSEGCTTKQVWHSLASFALAGSTEP